MGRHSLAEEPVPHPLDPPKRPQGRSETTGSHRIVAAKAPRRRIAKWPLACLGLVILVAVGVFGWNYADSVLNNRAEAQAATCTGTRTTVRVVVTPQIAQPVDTAAARWNSDLTQSHGACVHVDVESKPSADVLNALTGKTDVATIGGLPDGWIPESSYWITQLTNAKPALIGAPPMSIGSGKPADYPFVGLVGSSLGGPATDENQQRATQTFRAYLKEPAQLAAFAAAGIRAA
ncbi:substrate-binding domain-containing protein [Amycolatopsis sp. FDAARGOS 1241]|uniref:substrate-binding domain-containing protein n=1 Tax=Amycolatopsis sp. FDAARGOS 1241 TaxID=2778070 RepID=UPI00194EF845|nr:substrate-binding domain-containing protein [Amycolatopsis sp. FDAARGOS 1241]QRP49637.1 substrate-binding domain-containing protein [Amycolatopsis sp. FDAARGOS 1241]